MPQQVKDYYKLLGLTNTCDVDDIKKAYHSLALKLHPDKNPAVDAEERFKEVGEAYEVLSDPARRKAYDRLKSPSRTGFGGSWNIFQEFLNCEEDAIAYTEDIETVRIFTDDKGKRVFIIDKSVRIEVPMTLEEISTGVSKSQVMTRRTYDPEMGKTGTEEVTFVINVKPGCTDGETVTYAKASHRNPGANRTPGNVILVMKQQPHPIFTRNGANVECHKRISLRQALTGGTLTLPSLDGRALRVENTRIIKPGAVRRFQGEGLPFTNQPAKRGDLLVHIDIDFPDDLSDIVQSKLKDLLP